MTSPNGTVTDVSPSARKTLIGPALGSQFDTHDRLFGSFDGGAVFDYSAQFEAGDLKEMLGRDGKARSLEQVLTLPLRSADYRMTKPAVGDRGQTAFCQDVLGEKLNLLLDQMTAAVIYRKTFHEKTWRLDGAKVVYAGLLWRPPASCDAGFDPGTGDPQGFRQRVFPINGKIPAGSPGLNRLPGYVYIPQRRAFVYTHGTHRDPIRGVSDLDVCYWAYQTRQKILFLWFQFLENQSLPKLAVYGDSLPQAQQIAEGFAQLKSSGILPMARPNDPQAKVFDLIESGGHGAAQFQAAVSYLEGQMSASVLAGFTDLPQAAVQGTGSYALSADQSEFFLASRQAVADEMADSVRRDIIGPLVAYNYGPDAPLPKFEIGPLSSKYVERALTMLQDVVRSRYSNVPRDFVDQLVVHTASFLGLDPEMVGRAIAADQQAVAAEQAAQQGAPPVKGGEKGLFPTLAPGDAGSPTVSGQAPHLSRAVTLATELVARAKSGQDPADAVLDMIGGNSGDGKAVDRGGGGAGKVPAADVEIDLAAVGGHHTPGTSYNWRHGWHPLNVATALLHRRRRAAEHLHRTGAPFADDHPGLRTLGPISSRSPAEMSDDNLDVAMQDAIHREDFTYLDRLGVETDKRDAKRAERAAKLEADSVRRTARANAMLDRMGHLIDQGVPEADAHSEVFGGTPQGFNRKQAISTLRQQGYHGSGFDQLARASFGDRVQQSFDQAERDTRGVLLNRETESANARSATRSGVQVHPRDLFGGSETRARKYASTELRSWWDQNGRTTLAEWKAELLGDSTQARNLRSRRGTMLA